MMQKSTRNRDGWPHFEDEELRTTNPPSHAKSEQAGREAALVYAQEELARLRIEIDEIAHIVEMAPAIEAEPPTDRRLAYGTILFLLAASIVSRNEKTA